MTFVPSAFAPIPLPDYEAIFKSGAFSGDGRSTASPEPDEQPSKDSMKGMSSVMRGYYSDEDVQSGGEEDDEEDMEGIGFE